MKKNIKEISLYMRAIPKTIYFNVKYFGIKSIFELPVIVSHNVLIKRIEGTICLKNKTRFGVKIGFGNVGIFDKTTSKSIWEVSGNVIFNGKAQLGHGTKISVGQNGVLNLGENFTITAESSIICNESISFGQDVLISWENLIMDTDFHKIYDVSELRINENKHIEVGNNVWIGSRCTLLKGSVIPDGNVIAANSVISKKMSTTNSIVGGNPVRVLKENIRWEL